MNNYLYSGFMDEMEKIAISKKSIPWALSRGITGAGSTLAIGLVMHKVLKDLKKKEKEAKGLKSKAKAVAPLAVVGGGLGLAKGYSEKSLENVFKKLLKVR